MTGFLWICLVVFALRQKKPEWDFPEAEHNVLELIARFRHVRVGAWKWPVGIRSCKTHLKSNFMSEQGSSTAFTCIRVCQHPTHAEWRETRVCACLQQHWSFHAAGKMLLQACMDAHFSSFSMQAVITHKDTLYHRHRSFSPRETFLKCE